MKVNNLYAKPILKAIFFIVILLGLVNAGVLLTQIQPFTDLVHISIAVTLFILAGLLMSKTFFIKYNSEDAVLEIERAGLFSGKNAIHSGQLGFVMTKIDSYAVEKKWYGGTFTLGYSTSTGKPYSKTFPIFFASTEMMISMSKDLSIITNTVLPVENISIAMPTNVLKNSPALS